MENKITKNLEARINKILEDREKTASAFKEQLSNISLEIEATESAIKEAITAADATAYRQHRAKLETLTLEREFAENKLHALLNEPLISSEDYKECLASVSAEIEHIKSETESKLIELAEEMAATVKDIEIAYSAAHSTLDRLQNEIYLNSNRRRTASGEIVYLDSENATRALPNISGLLSMGYAAVATGYYSRVTGSDPSHKPDTRFW